MAGQWKSIDTVPDLGQPVRIRSSCWEGIACCHGYDTAHMHEWYDEEGNRLSSFNIGIPDEWLEEE